MKTPNKLDLAEVIAKKNAIQEEGYNAWLSNNKFGQCYMATGTGKSRLAILGHIRNFKDCDPEEILLAVPTRKLRDRNWEFEYTKWATAEDYAKVMRCCYKSISKIKGRTFKYVIFDECHNITEASSEFMKNNNVESCIMLTATEPESVTKQLILRQIAPVVFSYTLDQGVNDGIVQPYHIIVVETQLDNKVKYIEAGSKAKRFYQTEKAYYEYLNKLILKFRTVGNYGAADVYVNKRMHFMYGLRSKSEVAKRLINHLHDRRLLIFCGNTNQCEEIAPGFGFHTGIKASEAEINFEKFLNHEIGKLTTCSALNEGHNIDDIDTAVVVQIRSVMKDLIQQLGRIVRWRDDKTGEEHSIMYVVCCRNTVDENWMEAAFEGIDRDRITYISDKNFN